MKKIILAILIIVLIVLFGTWPLSVVAKILEILANMTRWLAKALNFFNWNGIL